MNISLDATRTIGVLINLFVEAYRVLNPEELRSRLVAVVAAALPEEQQEQETCHHERQGLLTHEALIDRTARRLLQLLPGQEELSLTPDTPLCELLHTLVPIGEALDLAHRCGTPKRGWCMPADTPDPPQGEHAVAAMADYAEARCDLSGPVVRLSGVVFSPAQFGTIATLPAHMRPSATHIFNVPSLTGSMRIDVKASGVVSWTAVMKTEPNPTGAGPAIAVASLNRIAFVPYASGKPHPYSVLALANGWAHYGSGYQGGHSSKVGDIVFVSGLVKPGQAWGHFATLPDGSRPSRRLIFNCNNSANSFRIDVQPDGKISYVGGTHNSAWIALDGIVFAAASFPSAGTIELPLVNDWVFYGGNDYRPATYFQVDTVMYLSGLIKRTAGTAVHFVTLPPGCTPPALPDCVSRHAA